VYDRTEQKKIGVVLVCQKTKKKYSQGVVFGAFARQEVCSEKACTGKKGVYLKKGPVGGNWLGESDTQAFGRLGKGGLGGTRTEKER